MKWKLLPISEVFVLKQGTYLDTEEMVESRTGEFPFAVYGANGIVGYSKRMMYTERTPLISCRGANCGVVHFTEPNAWVGNNSIACIPKREVDQRFFFYQFSNSLFTDVITGSAQPQITLTNLSPKLIVVPPITIQHTIGDILSIYDDLIENNRRRMGLLEKAARLLYEEWFVRLRFPGHEHTPIQNGLPQGWERVPTSEAIEINPKSRLTDEDEHWYVEMADLPTNSMVIQNAVKRDGRNGSKFQNGDTLLARITPCLENGKTGFVDFMLEGEIGRGSTEFIVLRSKRVTSEFVYCLARTYHFRENAIKSMVGSSGRQRVQESCFEKFQVLVPPQSVLNIFTDNIRPIFNQIHNLHLQTQALRAARDLLLPRLMSGEIEV